MKNINRRDKQENRLFQYKELVVARGVEGGRMKEIDQGD